MLNRLYKSSHRKYYLWGDFFMTKQEYQHIRNLAWDLLIDANITSLPTDLLAIANLYNGQDKIDVSKSTYENAISISQHILQTLGYKSSTEHSKCLAVRILSPVVVLKELKVKSTADIVKFTNLPFAEANKRYVRLQELIARGKFETSNMETKVLRQFKPWLSSLSLS